jgi:hypothetical protein
MHALRRLPGQPSHPERCAAAAVGTIHCQALHSGATNLLAFFGLETLSATHTTVAFPSMPAEADARSKGVQRLVLLTTRTADWFEQRGFRAAGPAHTSALLPEARRAKVDPARNSQLYAKNLMES